MRITKTGMVWRVTQWRIEVVMDIMMGYGIVWWMVLDRRKMGRRIANSENWDGMAGDSVENRVSDGHHDGVRNCMVDGTGQTEDGKENNENWDGMAGDSVENRGSDGHHDGVRNCMVDGTRQEFVFQKPEYGNTEIERNADDDDDDDDGDDDNDDNEVCIYANVACIAAFVCTCMSISKDDSVDKEKDIYCRNSADVIPASGIVKYVDIKKNSAPSPVLLSNCRQF